MVYTGEPLDLAIDGPGWFVLRDTCSAQFFVTRRGAFQVDSDGYLISSSGLRLQGYNDPDLKTQGDLQLDSACSPDLGLLQSWDFASNGQMVVTLSTGEQFVRGQVLLQNFSQPGKLFRINSGLYEITSEAGPLDHPVAPGSTGLGEILFQYLDMTPEPVRLALLPSAAQTGALTQGALTPTEIDTDLGIHGPGFFLVRDTNNSELFATRAGMFLRDGEGYLVTYNGNRVQGYSDPGLGIPGDVLIDETGGLSGLGLDSFRINPDGTVVVTLLDGSWFVRSQVRLFTFCHPNLLVATNLGRYSGVAQAEPQALQTYGIWPDNLELINVSADLLALRQTRSLFPQGPIVFDDISSHVAISGRGFFALRNPVDDTTCVTRLGAFQLDGNGYLVASNGFRVQGYNDPALSTLGDVRIDTAGSPDPQAQVLAYTIGLQGQIEVILQDETSFVRGQLLLQSFRDPSLLVQSGNELYTNLAPAGPLPLPVAPTSGGLGYLVARALESPVDPAPLVPPSRQGVRLLITGESGCYWTIQASTNLTAWTPLKEQAQSPSELDFTDSDSSAHPCRFYRVLVGAPQLSSASR
jgi:flagellar hook protein FlgE